MRRILIEICCGSAEDCIIAEKAGAHRVELNSALFLGGLTPSIGNLLLAKKILSIPVMAMIRPRAAGFCYSEYEYETMKIDAALALENGADGIVFGFLHGDGTVDRERTREFVRIAGDKEAVFHRAFDVTPEPFAALERLMEAGVKRVLTSGQKPNVCQGAELIKELIKRADGRIEILPGAGLDSFNAKSFVESSGTTQIHVGVSEFRKESSTRQNPEIYFGGALYPDEGRVEVASFDGISKIVSAC